MLNERSPVLETKEYEVIIKLISNKNPCHSGHKIGEEWGFDFRPPQGLCGFAYNTLFPFAVAMKTGGTFPGQSNPDILTISCPDSEVGNCFQIRRRLIK
jgi:uncharacterized repeat protein (TIGR04076 family)